METSVRAQTRNIALNGTVVKFKTTMMGFIPVVGSFNVVGGELTIDDLTGFPISANAEIDATSIRTGIGVRDAHVRAGFLHTSKHQRITFKSKRVVPNGSTAFDMSGELTIHGKTRDVCITGTSTTRRCIGTVELNRTNFDVVWSRLFEGWGVGVGDKVRATVDLPV